MHEKFVHQVINIICLTIMFHFPIVYIFCAFRSVHKISENISCAKIHRYTVGPFIPSVLIALHKMCKNGNESVIDLNTQYPSLEVIVQQKRHFSYVSLLEFPTFSLKMKRY